MLCTKTSAVSINFKNASRPPGVFRSSVTLRLLRFMFKCIADMRGLRRGPVSRFGSPACVSILITSAPMSPRICVATGPSTFTVRSMTRTPLSGPLGVSCTCCSWGIWVCSSSLQLGVAPLDESQWRVFHDHGAVLLDDTIACAHEPAPRSAVRRARLDDFALDVDRVARKGRPLDVEGHVQK